MKKIQIKVLNPDQVKAGEHMMVCCARLTQSGHKINNIDDFIELYNKPYSIETVEKMSNLPHPTIKRFSEISIVIVGQSRRALAQITRSQAGFTFMSSSLQYSNFSDINDFVIPYHLLDNIDLQNKYLESCKNSMNIYKELSKEIGHDEAAFASPESLRNVLVISANPLAWRQFLKSRTCSRNSLETQYIALLIWEKLYELSPELFNINSCGPDCQTSYCKEGKMSCKNKFDQNMTPGEIIKLKFPLLRS